MKALILLGTAKIGGAELQGLALGKLLQENGLEVEIGCLSTNGKYEISLLKLANKNNLHLNLIEFNAKSQILYVLRIFKIARHISVSYDFCFGFTKVPSIITSMCSRRVTKIWLQRDVMKNKALYLFDYVIALKSDFILANSYLASRYISQRILFLKKVKCLGNLQDVRFRKYPVKQLKNSFQCISVSNFKESKNMDQLIKLWIRFAEIPEVKVQRIRLILIGNFYDSNYNRAHIQSLKRKYNIIVINNCSDPFNYYNSSMYYLTLTSTESRSNSIDHAMYFSLPVIGFKHSSIYEQVDHSNHELLIEQGHHDRYVEILLECYRNPQKYVRVGQKNKTKIHNYFLKSHSQWNEFINNMLEAKAQTNL
jgi:glycosyltransferase involved in cell wall biosynthesis